MLFERCRFTKRHVFEHLCDTGCFSVKPKLFVDRKFPDQFLNYSEIVETSLNCNLILFALLLIVLTDMYGPFLSLIPLPCAVFSPAQSLHLSSRAPVVRYPESLKICIPSGRPSYAVLLSSQA